MHGRNGFAYQAEQKNNGAIGVVLLLCLFSASSRRMLNRKAFICREKERKDLEFNRQTSKSRPRYHAAHIAGDRHCTAVLAA